MLELDQKKRIVRFVRDVLGCGCPPEVFEHVELDRFLPSFSGLPVARTITVGGRLLVLLCEGPMSAAKALELLGRGRQIRDTNGLNRVRCVVPSSAWDGSEPASIQTGDDRLHVHVVNDADIPI